MELRSDVNINKKYLHDKIHFYGEDINFDILNMLINMRKQHAKAYQTTDNIEHKENIMMIINGINTQINQVIGTNKIDLNEKY